MGLQETLSQVMSAVESGKVSDADIHSAYEKVAGQIPQGDLSASIAHVLSLIHI